MGEKLRRGESQNINSGNYQGKVRRVDGIFVSRKRVDRSQKTTQLPKVQMQRAQTPKKIVSQPAKISQKKIIPPSSPKLQPSKTHQPILLKKPELTSPEQSKTYQFEPSKPTRTTSVTKEPSFFEVPLAQEYEKDQIEKSAIYKRFAIAGSFFVVLISLVLSGVFLFKKQDGIQEKIYAYSNSGKNSLLSAQDFLINLDFDNAEKSFASAYEDFEKIEKELSSLGQSNILMAKVPNNDSIVVQGEKLVSVAKDFSYAGKEVTSCGSLFSDISLLDQEEINSWQAFSLASEKLARADSALENAQKNLSYINPKALPEIAGVIFELKGKLPFFREVLALFEDVIGDVPALLGKEKSQQYLLLFQNPAEARATGGFLGNYGYLAFNKGKMIGPEVFDIYKLQWLTQGKREIIKPPEEIFEAGINFWKKSQWQIQDTNWDIDFPTTAKKIEWYYNEYDQGLTEGVIAVDPLVFSDILEIIGPIKLSKYKATVNQKNFWQVMERKVEVDNPFKRGEAEYKDANPKQILKDFAPLFMAKIKKANDAQRHQITRSIYENIKRKHILLFANNNNLQEIFKKLNWCGEVKQAFSDYIYVNESNIGVDKSSSRIKQTFDLQVDIKEEIKNHLKITRKHNGGVGNRMVVRNLSYLRILVPKGSTLNSFLIDGKDVARRIFLSEEAGKTKFGIITRVEPQKTQIIEITYTLPIKIEPTSITPKYYSLYFQKQPGRVKDQLSVDLNIDPAFKIKSIESEKGGNFAGNSVEFLSDLLEDRIFNILLSK